MGYLTVSELKSSNGIIDEIKNYIEDGRLQFLIDFCSSIIDSYVGFNFYKEENISVLVDGDDNNKIRLPKRAYLITQVKDINTSNIYKLSSLVLTNKSRSILCRDDYFSYGDLNIEVTGNFGWATVPQDIINCLVMLCSGNFGTLGDIEKLENKSGPFTSETIGNYSYTLKNRILGDGQIVTTTGDQQVDQILESYKQSNITLDVI